MSLPKEPRQKMINMMYLVLTALLALNVSSEILNAFKTVNKSIDKSNLALGDQITNVMENFKNAKADPKTKANAELYEPMALKASATSKTINDYIESLKKKLIAESGGKADGTYNIDNLDVATRLFAEGQDGKDLEAKLTAYITDMQALNNDPKFAASFNKYIAVDKPADVVGQDGTKQNWRFANFHMVPSVAGITILSKLQNDIKNTESQIANYFFSKVSSVKVIYDKFAALTGANSTYFFPGQKMEITAGIGSFSADAKPTIKINGASVPVDANGVGTSTFDVGGSGSKTANVEISYVKPDGTTGTERKTIEYTVGVPGGASIFLEKMNVFYMGVDNPVTISSASGWEKTTVGKSGNLSLSGSNGKYTVRATGEGTSTITVTSDNKPSTFTFRNLPLPNPPATLGALDPGPQPTAQVKGQMFMLAKLPDFIFETQFNVTSFTMIISKKGSDPTPPMTSNGNQLSGAMQTELLKLTPGSTVTIYNIGVMGPDGKSRTAKAISYLCK
jgi:gliding motility-associated protein GldM